MSFRAVASLLIVAVAATPSPAVIQRTVSLKSVLDAEGWISVARIDKIEAQRAELIIRRNLKGTSDRQRVTLDMTGDAVAQEAGQPKQLAERLTPGIDVILFGSIRAGRTSIVGYSNGTWFRMSADAKAGTATAATFTHFEPYLRRTFRGTTSELQETIIDCLSGVREPPAPDAQMPPGIGPPLKQ